MLWSDEHAVKGCGRCQNASLLSASKGAQGDGWRWFFREELGLVKLKLLTGSFRCAVTHKQ